MKLPTPLTVILVAGLVCGTLDALSASLVSALFGATPIRVFQGIASGLRGRSAFQGGVSTALLGLGLHYVVALGAAATYYWASRFIPVMNGHAWSCGVIFGALTHLFMNFVVIPLSAIGSRPFAPKSFLAFLAVSMVVVGPSISLTVRRLAP